MKKTPVVRQLGVEVVADPATGSEVIQLYLLDARNELGIEYLVDSPSMLVQGFPFRQFFNE